MDRTAFVLMVMLAAAGYSAAAERACADPELCLLAPPPDYGRHQPAMAAKYHQNKELIEAQKFDDFEGFESYITSDTNNCQEEITVETPYVIQTNDSLLHNVVQLEHFKQKIMMRKCYSAGAACFGSVFTADAGGVTASCAQKYGAVSLYVYDASADEMRYQAFPVPVACVCSFRRT